MAQTGYTPISLYYSTTAAAAPTAGNLVAGELALNTQDEKLYFKNAAGTVKLLASSAGASGDVVGPASSTDNAIVRFDGTTGKLVQNSVVTIADSTGDISGVGQLNATTLDATNVEVTNIKAKDGTASATIADSTGVMTIGSSVLTTTDINGGTIDATAIGGTTPAAGAFTTLSATGNVTLSGGTANGVAYLNGSKVLTTGSALTFDGSALEAVNATSAQIAAVRGTQRMVIGADGFTNAYVGTTTAHDVSFLRAGSEQMRLTSTGLGIGTSSPGQKLHVVGDGNFARATATDTYVQVSNSVATFNITQSANGSTYLYNYGSYNLYFGTGAATKMTLDSSGNLGLGVTPSAWNTVTAMQLAGGASLGGYSNTTYLNNNAYYNSGTGWTYIGASTATQYYQNSGKHIWQTAASGTAGNAISFTQAMTLDASGQLGIGSTSPTQVLTIAQGGNFPFIHWNNSSNTNIAFAGWHGGTGGDDDFRIGTTGAKAFTFRTNNTERMRIDSSGNVGIGTSSPGTKLDVYGSDPRIQSYNSSGPKNILLAGGTVGYTGTTTNHPLAFITNDTERMRIDSSGNLLLGSSSTLGYRSQIFSATNGYTQALVQTSAFNSGNLAGTVYSGYYDGSSITDMASIRGGKENTTSGNYAGMLAFYTRPNGGSDTERMRIDSSGVLLVGATASVGSYPKAEFHNSGTTCEIGVYGNNYGGVIAKDQYSGKGTACYYGFAQSANIGFGQIGTTSNHAFTFITNGAERARIDSSGRFLINLTSSLYSSGNLQINGGKTIIQSGDSGYAQLQIGNEASGGEASISFISGVTAFGTSPTSTNGDNCIWAVGAAVFGMGGNEWGIGNKGAANYVAKIAYNSTSWTFSSDERLKNLDGEIENAVDKVSALRAVYYSWKNDDAQKRKVGLIAQDVLKVLPEAVDVPEQETRDDGTPNYLGLGMSDVVPLLVAAIKELKADLDATKAELAALKGN